MKDTIFTLSIIFVICVTLSFIAGEDKGCRDFYKGKVECVEVFEKIECRLKPK